MGHLCLPQEVLGELGDLSLLQGVVGEVEPPLCLQEEGETAKALCCVLGAVVGARGVL